MAGLSRILIGVLTTYAHVIRVYQKQIKVNLGLEKMEDEFDETVKFAKVIFLRTVLYLLIAVVGLISAHYLVNLIIKSALK